MSHPLTRRDWLGLASAASLSTTLPEAQQRGTPARLSAAHDLGARVYNVRDHGATEDGKTLDTKAVQAAIDACNRDGGGTVLVPAGAFHIGTIEMKSNVTLYLAVGGTLLGSADGTQYHAVDAIPLRGDSTLVHARADSRVRPLCAECDGRHAEQRPLRRQRARSVAVGDFRRRRMSRFPD